MVLLRSVLCLPFMPLVEADLSLTISLGTAKRAYVPSTEHSMDKFNESLPSLLVSFAS